MKSRVILAIALVAIGLGVWRVRKGFIRTFFVDGVAGAAPRLTAAPPGMVGLAPVERVRVVLLDGLGAGMAAGLPELSRLCAGGLELRVDVGFPTVSLPVQAALWTGLTQQQSGIQYRVAALPRAPAGAAPAAVPGAIALAEDQAFIASSFGFAQVRPLDAEVAATERLVFVHLLRIDKAGHRTGPASAKYRAAAEGADQVLGRLVQQAPPDPTTRWFVLSDHGHRPRGGGHGGAEPAVRMVRACIAGGGTVPAAPPPPAVHLVDLSRALFDSLGLPPNPGAVGRPLGFALAHPDPGATLPRASRWRWLAAGALLLAGLLATGLRWRRPLAALPWWLPVAYASVVLFRGLPTLSNPIVYPPLGRDIVLAGAPGLVLLAVLTVVAHRRDAGGDLRTLAALCLAPLVLPAACAAAALVGARGSQPPLLPLWTAHASVLLSLLSAAALVVAAVLLGLAAASAARKPAG